MAYLLLVLNLNCKCFSQKQNKDVNMKNFFNKSVFVSFLVLGLSAPAFANLITLDIEWSGASFQNSASATGFITFDDTLCMPEVDDCDSLSPGSGIIDLGVTISGASAGNGTFGLSDFIGITFLSNSVLNFNTQLIGQMMTNGCAFGTSTGTCGDGSGGDFNLFRNTASAPNGTWYFNLSADGGDQMLVTSMLSRTAVPEPSTIVIFGVALLGMVSLRRKKS
jgi:hypothetical protein